MSLSYSNRKFAIGCERGASLKVLVNKPLIKLIEKSLKSRRKSLGSMIKIYDGI